MSESNNTKCPLCGGEITAYSVRTLGDMGPTDRHVGCPAREGECLLARKSWSLAQWGELCSLVARSVRADDPKPMSDVSDRKRAEVFALAVALKSSGRLDRMIGKYAVEIWHHVNDALEGDK